MEGVTYFFEYKSRIMSDNPMKWKCELISELIQKADSMSGSGPCGMNTTIGE